MPSVEELSKEDGVERVCWYIAASHAALKGWEDD